MMTDNERYTADRELAVAIAHALHQRIESEQGLRGAARTPWLELNGPTREALMRRALLVLKFIEHHGGADRMHDAALTLVA